MNILFMTDLEGITNVDSADMIPESNKEGYRKSVENLMGDLNAAISGAFDGGAEKVFVIDGHATGINFDLASLDPRAIQLDLLHDGWEEYVASGRIHAYGEIGSHAMAGTQNAFLDHTMSSTSWWDFSVNGKSWGELAIGAAYVGYYDIPLVMVSGDIAACEEAKRFCGDIATAPVKRAVGRNTAVSIPTEEARKLIYEAAKRGMSLVGKIKPFKVILPAEVKLTYFRADYCDGMEKLPGVERLDSRTIRKTVKRISSYRTLYNYRKQ